MQGIALLIAVCSAAGFALSTSLQHLAADRAPEASRGGLQLLAHLALRPRWVIGQVVAVVAFVLHVQALRLGALVIVQPVIVSGIVLAVPVSAALARRLPSRTEMVPVALTAAGIALFLVAARPVVGHVPAQPWVGVALTLAGAGVAAAATWRGGRCRSGERAAFWFGAASGVLFGLVAGLIKLTTLTLGAHSSTASGTSASLVDFWSAGAVAIVGLSGVAINQRAYRAARLSASMPVLNIVDALVALAFGVVVFGEYPAHNGPAIAAQMVAFVCVAVGLRRLGRSEFFAQATNLRPPAPPDQLVLACGSGSLL
jgi:hypothetical protein